MVRSRAVRSLLLCALLGCGPLEGCGTILTFTGTPGPPDPISRPNIFGGIRLDATVLSPGDMNYHGTNLGWVRIFSFLDLPLSLGLDILTLPITIPIVIVREPDEKKVESPPRDASKGER